ncbi:MAG: LCP family protein [Lachnospiraceae bacterium]|nr:LCP family protein [Lachnospiraceae bacterium]MBR4607816.1 LCP family protein [Lachnospiraceae bacterium]MBR6150188.1 LCP family protein [Lachnospiraceae bacterium]
MKNNFKIHRIVLKVLLWLVIISAVGFLVFVGLQVSGKNRLYKKSANKRPDLSVASVTWEEDETTEEGEGSEQTSASVPILQTEDEGDNWEEGDLRYKGVHYRYNDEMLTFLFMGIDKKKGTVKEAKNGIDGGQSDAMFLMALNPKTKEATLININRDTMTDIDVYTETGVFLATMKRQITLQHGYGDGKEISCERSVSAVSKLFYNLPIHGYCAINLEAVPKINDAVGGVDVVALEDVKEGSKTIFKEGQKVHLSGKFATLYVQSRDDSFGSAGRRAERQKQYVVAYADAARAAMKKNVTVLVDLFKTISKYMVTDITVDEVSYFSTQVADYKFDGSRMYSLQGETKMGEEHEEFYADEKALFELILKVYYDVIDD